MVQHWGLKEGSIRSPKGLDTPQTWQVLKCPPLQGAKAHVRPSIAFLVIRESRASICP